MPISIKQIAESFSKGDFAMAIPHLSDSVEWTVIGERSFSGKVAVIKNCEQVANYFKSVTTEFKTQQIIIENNKVVINGTAEFTKGNKKISFISACDIYEFNVTNELQKITSYCIPDKTILNP